jgi:hypothetical protein
MKQPFEVKAIKEQYHKHSDFWDLLVKNLAFLKDNNLTARKIYDASIRNKILPAKP